MEKMTKTNTTIFFVPTLKIGREKLQDNNFLNAYLKDELRELEYEDSVCLLFKPNNLDKFHKFIESEYEKKNTNIIDDYDYEDGYVVSVYRLNDDFKKDFNMIKQGQYSLTSKEFQQLFPKVLKLMVGGLHRDEISLQYRVFNKTRDMKEYWEKEFGVEFTDNMEVWELFDENKEVLNIEKLKNNV
jgi:hypothetical protein